MDLMTVDLKKPVLLKKSPMPFDMYCQTYRAEQSSSIEYLGSPGMQWNVPQSLTGKVSECGALLPFFGDTITIPIAARDAVFLSLLQSKMYQSIGDMLAEPLMAKHFHVTLHDLSSGSSESDLHFVMGNNRARCRDIFRETSSYLFDNPDCINVNIRAERIFPCCNISLILALLPDKDRDYRIMMNLYNLFDDVVYLDYWLRIHVTLAYFKPSVFTGEQIARMLAALREMEGLDRSITLDMKKVAYQHFTSMNSYRTHMSMSDFRPGLHSPA